MYSCVVMIQKIAIIGISGSGKSSLSRVLHNKTGLPVFHMDAIFWRGNWEPVPEAECLEQHAKLLRENDRWIIEGYIDASMAARLVEADRIIYIDLPGYTCALRVLKRVFKHRNESRPELPKEALERFSLKFFWRVLRANERTEITRALAGIDTAKVTRVRTASDIAALVL